VRVKVLKDLTNEERQKIAYEYLQRAAEEEGEDVSARTMPQAFEAAVSLPHAIKRS
jgi:hypothetical protein